MTKKQLIDLLGSGVQARAVEALGCTRQALYELPKKGPIPQHWEDRAIGAAYRTGRMVLKRGRAA